MNKYDIFISVPMSALGSQKEFLKIKNNVLSLMEKLSSHNYSNVFFAGTKVNQINDLDNPEIAAKMDFLAIEQSDLFIIIYPKKILSSSIIELGYAMALRKKILICCAEKKIMPFILLDIDKIYENITISEYYGNYQILFNNMYKYLSRISKTKDVNNLS